MYSDVDQDNAVILIERWKTREKLEQRICSEDFRKILLAMDCAVEPPEIQFSTVASHGGIELIGRIRGEQIERIGEAT